MTALFLLLCEEKWLHGVRDPYLATASTLRKIIYKITENHKEHLHCAKAKKFRCTIEFNGKWLTQLILLRYCQVIWMVSAACITSATLPCSRQFPVDSDEIQLFAAFCFIWFLKENLILIGFMLLLFVCCFAFIFAVHAYYLNVLNANLSTHRAQAQANQLIAVTRYSSISLAMEKGGKKKGRWESSGMDTYLELEMKRNHGDETCFFKSASWIRIFCIPCRILWEDERNRRGESLCWEPL